MDRIAIIGLAGSGKSTFANRLGKKLDRPVVHLDKEYWTGDWKKKYTSKEDWANFQRDLVKSDTWIIDGNYSSSLDIRLERADIIVFFDLPKWQCLWRAFARTFNRSQPFDKPEGAKEKIDWELIKFILNYSREEAKALLGKYKDNRQIFMVKNDKEIAELLTRLTN